MRSFLIAVVAVTSGFTATLLHGSKVASASISEVEAEVRAANDVQRSSGTGPAANAATAADAASSSTAAGTAVPRRQWISRLSVKPPAEVKVPIAQVRSYDGGRWSVKRIPVDSEEYTHAILSKLDPKNNKEHPFGFGHLYNADDLERHAPSTFEAAVQHLGLYSPLEEIGQDNRLYARFYHPEERTRRATPLPATTMQGRLWGAAEKEKALQAWFRSGNSFNEDAPTGPVRKLIA